MAKILVAGGAGFLGSHICDALLSKGHNVTCVDNFCTGNKENLAHLQGNPNFVLIDHDIVEPLDLEADYILNLACPASPPRYQERPIFTFKTCVWGTLNLLELATKNNAVLFHASTSEIYGDPIEHPQVESHWGHVNPIGIRSCYDEGKRGAETLCFDYHREYGTKIKVVRIFNTYGPRMDAKDGRVVSNFINQALVDQDITLYGDGSQTRSFCYLDDMVAGILAMTFSDEAITGPINLGNPVEFSVKSLAEKIIELTGSNSKLSICPLPSDDPRQRKPNIELAAAKLNWSPKYTLEQGLEKTISYFKHKLYEPQN